MRVQRRNKDRLSPEPASSLKLDGLRWSVGRLLARVYNPGVVGDDSGEIIIIDEPIEAARIVEMAADTFGDMVKGVVDIKLRLLALGGGLHSDEEAALMARGSAQEDLWGINIFPDRLRSDWIEFDSLINVRPRQDNRSRSVEDAGRRTLIAEIVDSLVR